MQTNFKPKEWWTKRHDEFCLNHRLPPAAQFLWRWLLRDNGNQTGDADADLKDFNEWVAQRRGKGYSTQTLKDAMARLEEHNIVKAIKFTWRFWKVAIRPIAFLMPKKNWQNREEICDFEDSNDEFSEASVNSSSINNTHPEDPLSEPNFDPQEIEAEEILKECQDAGIYYEPSKPSNIIKFSLEQVRKGLQLFKLRYPSEQDRKTRVANPQGWLINCVRGQWWESDDLFWNWETKASSLMSPEQFRLTVFGNAGSCLADEIW